MKKTKTNTKLELRKAKVERRNKRVLSNSKIRRLKSAGIVK